MQICLNISLNLEASYFNEKVAEWEPLVEPIPDDSSQRPMELEISVSAVSDSCNIPYKLCSVA